MKRSVSSAMNAGLFLTPASVSAGDLLLVALKMPPSRTGTYSNFTPLRFSIAGIASWLRKALGLPKSKRNCGAVRLTAFSLAVRYSYMIIIIPTSLAVHCFAINRRVGAIAVGELDDVVANIGRPVRDAAGKPAAIVGEQQPRGFLEMRQVACHGRHEGIGGIPRRAPTIPVAVHPTGGLDQFAQGDRRAAGL